METRYSRDVYGWSGLTLIDLGDGRSLRILTARREPYDILVTQANCIFNDGDDPASRTRCVDDFRRVTAVSTPGRITESAVRAQHEATLGNINAVRAALARHDLRQARNGA